VVTVVDVHGKHGGAVCVYHCDKFDLALLKLVDGPLATGLSRDRGDQRRQLRVLTSSASGRTI